MFSQNHPQNPAPSSPLPARLEIAAAADGCPRRSPFRSPDTPSSAAASSTSPQTNTCWDGCFTPESSPPSARFDRRVRTPPASLRRPRRSGAPTFGHPASRRIQHAQPRVPSRGGAASPCSPLLRQLRPLMTSSLRHSGPGLAFFFLSVLFSIFQKLCKFSKTSPNQLRPISKKLYHSKQLFKNTLEPSPKCFKSSKVQIIHKGSFDVFTSFHKICISQFPFELK